jgi:hypothetical protein
MMECIHHRDTGDVIHWCRVSEWRETPVDPRFAGLKAVDLGLGGDGWTGVDCAALVWVRLALVGKGSRVEEPQP